MDNELCWQSAVELAAGIRRGEFSASEVLDAHIARIEEVNPRLNALVVRCFDEARRDASTIDAARTRGDSLGPLAGVPVSIKECYFVTGTPATVGVSRLLNVPGGPEGPLVTRLRQAGAVILGKTNVPQLMLMHETDNPVYGRTNNPWDLERGPGGSSGGEAALIAAGGSPLGLGTDLGGSIRQPAHSCGIHGFKPSRGRLPFRGAVSNLNGFEAIGVEPGPMARHVADLVLADRVLLGEQGDAVDAQIAPVPWRDPAEVSLRGLRVAMWTDDGFFTPSPALRRAVVEAGAALKERGATVEPFRPPDVADGMRLYFGLLSADGGSNAKALLGNSERDPRITRLLRLGAIPRSLRPALAWTLDRLGQQRSATLLAQTGRLPTDAFVRLTYERTLYTRRFLAALDAGGFSAMICPPHSLVALKHGTFNDLTMAGSYVMLPNLLGLPAGVVAATRVRPGEESDRPKSRDWSEQAASSVEQHSAGLPVGVQVAALPWRDDVVLAVMAALEQHFRQSAEYPLHPPI